MPSRASTHMRSPLMASGVRALLPAARRRMAGIADRMAVTAIRLAVLGAVVWSGTSIVTHVTTALQDIARPGGMSETMTAAR